MNTFIPELSEIDHVARVVPSIEEFTASSKELLRGWELSAIEEIAEQGVRVLLLSPPNGSGTKLEILEPLSENNSVGRFLKSRGAGLHHIAFRVENVGEMLRCFSSRGIPLIDTVPRVGAGGKPIAFLHPSAFGGVLVEICQPIGGQK